MKIKKHLVAATLAVGLVGSATAIGTTDGPANALIGYDVAKAAFNNHPAAQAGSQGGGAAVGGLLGGLIGTKIGVAVGAKYGAAIGAACGPIGVVVGAVAGAV
ncbi:MAG: hypothetical protein OXH15_14320 [Gammaproteobacteria bacterium]|nr:hypothetical protein [Gammaproteobacteria bacterium]